jgi:uncharacterized membrane protein
VLLPLLAAAAMAWLTLIVTAPILPVPVAGALYAVGSFICHQRPERSFHLFAAQLPVCARCTGIYAGAALGSLLAAVSAPVRIRAVQAPARLLLLAGGTPTLVTLVLEWSGAWLGSNVVRALAGLPIGIAVAFVVVQAAATLHYEECAPPRPIETSRPPTHT